MKNSMLNFKGVKLSVSFNREKAEPIVENISKGCLNESNTPDPDELINSLTYMSQCDKSKFMDKLDTSLTGDYIKEQEHLIDEEIWEDYKELQNIMCLMYAYEALQSGNIDLVKSALKKLLQYFNPEFQRENSEELLNEYVDKLSEDEMRKYLANFIEDNLEKSSFFSAALMVKEQEKQNISQSGSGSGGGGGYGNYSSVPTVKALTNDDNEKEKVSTPENVKEIEKVKNNEEQKTKDVLKSDNSKKETEEQTTQTKHDDKIKQDFLNSSSDKKKQTTNENNNNQVKNIKNTIASTDGKNLSNSVSGVAEKGIETVKDLIASGGKIKKELNGKLSSSISSIANKGIETIKPIINSTNENTANSNVVLPGVAGLSTAAVAGLGTKIYIDKKDVKDKDKEKDETTKSIDDTQDKEEKNDESTVTAMSKEDLVRALENKN